MEIIQKPIRMKRRKCNSQLQITLEDDFNVPDTKPDVEQIVTTEGNIELSESNVLNGKLMLKGILHFQLLYISRESDQIVQSIQGKVEFDEMVNMNEICPEDDIRVKCDLEDLNISLINSRKISVKSLVSLYCCGWELYEEDVPVGINGEASEPCKYEKLNLTQIIVDKKDIFRVKENFRLPTGKPNIYQMLYYDIRMQGVETRVQEGQILVRGEMVLFILYNTEENENGIEYYQAEQPFHSIIPCNGCGENMLLQMEREIQSKDLQIKTDEDGEERVLEAEVVWNLNIQVYEEKEWNCLTDMYSTRKNLLLERAKKEYRCFVFHNQAQLRINEQMELGKQQNSILQICHTMGKIQVEEQEWTENGIQIDGSVEIKILYIGKKDGQSIGEKKVMLPFSHTIDVQADGKNRTFEIKPELEQMNALLLGRDAIEVKLLMTLEVFVFDMLEKDMITKVEEQEFDEQTLENMPSMVGYLVQENEDLWTIAKRFYTTVEDVMQLNHMEQEVVERGKKLIIAKKC